MEGFPLLRDRRKYSVFFLLRENVPALVFICESNFNLLFFFDPSAAQRPLLPHAAAGPAADVEGGGGQREVPAESADSQPRPSLTSLGASRGRDPSVSLASFALHRQTVARSDMGKTLPKKRKLKLLPVNDVSFYRLTSVSGSSQMFGFCICALQVFPPRVPDGG